MQRRTRAIPLLLAALAAACAGAGAGGAPSPADAHTQEVCMGAPVPAGWLILNTHWDNQRCTQSAGQGDNMLTLWHYDDQPVGTEQQVCERNPTPPGWVASKHRWDPASCRFGRGIEIANVKTIKRGS